MRIIGRASLLTALALAPGAGGAWAQSFTGAGPAAPFTLPAGADPIAALARSQVYGQVGAGPGARPDRGLA